MHKPRTSLSRNPIKSRQLSVWRRQRCFYGLRPNLPGGSQGRANGLDEAPWSVRRRTCATVIANANPKLWNCETAMPPKAGGEGSCMDSLAGLSLHFVYH